MYDLEENWKFVFASEFKLLQYCQVEVNKENSSSYRYVVEKKRF